ncbi:hypothetical protein BDQ17DRAFT_1391316 [Cyathus striatus]|nr:hypothetical protein BDQ17DRAFT_1391316 [Cyathus striatus]
MEDEEVNWLKIDGEFILPVLSVTTYFILLFLGGISEQCTEELIAVLKIPRDILENTTPGLQVAYQKYTACIKAVSEHNVMDKNRTWPVAKATKKEIISVFVLSSTWYDNYSNFDKIANFPAMHAWLAGDKESPTDLDLWGFESDHYTFLDLKKWLKEKVEKRKGKGKSKSKEEKGDKDEGTSERKEKSNEFILSNFGSNITYSATLLIFLHARQQNAKLKGEKNVDATAWIRLLARAIQEKIGKDSDDLFEDDEITEYTTEKDKMARLLKLYPFNKERKVFEGQLKPVSHAKCETLSCKGWALGVHTKIRDIPTAILIKGSKISEYAYVVSGVCKICKTLYSAEHECAHDETQGYYKVHLNSAKYLKVGQNLWVDRAFSQSVLNAYTEYWNNSFGNGKEISCRQVWQTFIHESIHMVATASDVDFIEAFAKWGENGNIHASHGHSCSECTQPYRETQDSPPHESATVKMVHCAYDNCSNTLVNIEEEFGARCPCNEHQEMWHKYNLEHSSDYLNGAQRMLCKPAENLPWNKTRRRHVQQPHDESDNEISNKKHYFKTICAPCGAVIAWTKFVKSESATNILKFLEDVFPNEESRPDYICIDKTCKVLRTAVANLVGMGRDTNGSWVYWFKGSHFVVDGYYYTNHHSDDYLCRKWCNPAPQDGSAPNLVYIAQDRDAFNTQACEQLNSWLGGFESIMKCMTPSNFNWFIHSMIFHHTQHDPVENTGSIRTLYIPTGCHQDNIHSMLWYSTMLIQDFALNSAYFIAP